MEADSLELAASAAAAATEANVGGGVEGGCRVALLSAMLVADECEGVLEKGTMLCCCCWTDSGVFISERLE